MPAISYILLICGLILLAGFPLSSLLTGKKQRADFWLWVPIIGVSGWIVGINLLFTLSRNYTVSAITVIIAFIALSIYALLKRTIPPIERRSALLLFTAFSCWVVYLIPYIQAGPGDYIGIFIGDGMSYARISDFYINYSKSNPFAPQSGLALVAREALYDRSGASILTALPAWITGREAKAFLYPINLLFTPLLIISTYLIINRLRLSRLIVITTISVLALNNFFLYYAYGSYAGKAIGIPLFLALLHLLYDTLKQKKIKYNLLFTATMGAAVALTYWELTPIAIFFFLGMLFVNLKKKRIFHLLRNSIIVLILIVILAPNLPVILNNAVSSRFKVTTSEVNTYWSNVKLKPYLLFMAGIKGPTKSSDQAPAFWNDMNKNKATELWRAQNLDGEIYLSWRLFLLLSIPFLIALMACDRRKKYFICIGVFTTVGGFIFLLICPQGKIFYNFLAYLSPFLIIVWATGLDFSYRYLMKRANWGLAVLFTPLLFYLLLVGFGTVYIIKSASKGGTDSSIYINNHHKEYYRYLRSTDELGEYFQTNVPYEKKIVFMDKGPEAIRSPWSPLKYWTFYELKNFDVRFFNPGGHFHTKKIPADYKLEGSLLVYLSTYKLKDFKADKRSGVVFTNDHFIVSTKEIPDISVGFSKRPAVVSTRKNFNGTNHLYFGSSNNFDPSKITKYSIEMWLKPGTNNTIEKTFTDTYPPTPAVVGSLTIFQITDRRLQLKIATGKEKDIFYTIEENSSQRWLHVELTVDNDKKLALLFINGELTKTYRDVYLPFKGSILLGKGHKNRYWKGSIGDLRISTTVRHTEDFDPTKTSAVGDDKTLFLLSPSML